MQYQVFVQNQITKQSFLASVVGIPNLTVEGKTEEEAIIKIKAALETQLAMGKFVTIEVESPVSPEATTPTMKYAGIFADDPSFDDFMEKLDRIRQEANQEQL
jgi:predicted RNase H-like HicB family nuclease